MATTAGMPASNIAAQGRQETSSADARALLIAYYYRSSNESGAARPARFAKYLGKAGVPVHVVTNGDPSNNEPSVTCVQERIKVARSVELASRVAYHIERRLLPYNECLPWVPYAVSAGSEIIRRNPIESIVSTSPPLAAHFAAWEIKRRFRLHWVADFRDPLSDNPFRNRRFTRPYDRAIERWLFRNADILIANTDTVANVWRKRYPQWANKVRFIWNGYDPDDLISAAPIPERPWSVLTHVGTLYGGRRPTVLLESLVRLIGSGRLNPDTFRLRLIGPLDTTVNRVDEPPFSTLVALGCLSFNGQPVPQAEARNEMATADHLLLLDVNETGAALQVPGKLFEYIRIGRPILTFTVNDSPTERILAASGIPYRAISMTAPPQTIDDAVGSFLKLPPESTQASKWFWREFDARAQAETLKTLLEQR